MLLERYNLEGDKLEGVEFDHTPIEVDPFLVNIYVVALRNNLRQGSRKTKTKAEVSGTGKKPHAQKGLGRARQGSKRSPQMVGGGHAHALRSGIPRKDMNQKERRKVNAMVLSYKLMQGDVVLLKYVDFPHRTKLYNQFLKHLGFQDQKIIFLTGEKSEPNIILGTNNLPKVKVASLSCINALDLIPMNKIVLLDDPSNLELFKSLTAGHQS